jgi:predicted dinucleotide-binding enzyme
MRIGILGSGLMGRNLGTIFARAGHEVVFRLRAATTSSTDWRVPLKARAGMEVS